MRLDVIINGVAESIEILAPAPSCRFAGPDGPERAAQVECPARGVYSVLMDGRVYDARIEEHPDTLVVVIDGFRFEIEVRDPRRWTGKSGRRGGEGVQTIAAPMPGKVIRLLVSPGDRVEAGQGLIVVEAMKMQNEMKAPRAGRILALHAREGATVSAGESLALLE